MFVIKAIEMGFLTLLSVWTTISMAYALPISSLRNWIDRHNSGLWVARWTMFGAARQRTATISRYRIEYRDEHPSGTKEAGWVCVTEGRSWVWHAALWQPGRRLADRLHRIAQDLDIEQQRGLAPGLVTARYRPLIECYLAAVKAPGGRREIKISAIRSTTDCAAPSVFVEVIAVFDRA